MPPQLEDRTRRIELIDTELSIVSRETAAGTEHTARTSELQEERRTLDAERAALQQRWAEEKVLAREIAETRKQIEADDDVGDKAVPRARLAGAHERLHALQGEQRWCFP